MNQRESRVSGSALLNINSKKFYNMKKDQIFANAVERTVYDALPETFSTCEGMEIAHRNGMPNDKFRSFMSDRFDLFKHSWGRNKKLPLSKAERFVDTLMGRVVPLGRFASTALYKEITESMKSYHSDDDAIVLSDELDSCYHCGGGFKRWVRARDGQMLWSGVGVCQELDCEIGWNVGEKIEQILDHLDEAFAEISSCKDKLLQSEFYILIRRLIPSEEEVAEMRKEI